jgi:hypothetical protein
MGRANDFAGLPVGYYLCLYRVPFLFPRVSPALLFLGLSMGLSITSTSIISISLSSRNAFLPGYYSIFFPLMRNMTMFDKNKFDQALSKAIEASQTPKEAAQAIQNLMQQTIWICHTAIQNAQARLMQKAISGVSPIAAPITCWKEDRSSEHRTMPD